MLRLKVTRPQAGQETQLCTFDLGTKQIGFARLKDLREEEAKACMIPSEAIYSNAVHLNFNIMFFACRAFKVHFI
jgi:hypothetical protein